MAWPKPRNKSSASLITESNHSGAAHDGARSQEKAPENAPGGQVRLPFLRAQGARRTEGAGGTAGAAGTGRAGGTGAPEAVRDASVTWPGQAEAEATAAEVAGGEATDPEPAAAEPESADLPLWEWSPPEDRGAEGASAEEPHAEREDPPKPEWKPVVTPVEEIEVGPRQRWGALSQLSGHPRMRVWRLRALAAAIVMVAFSILVSWKLGLTLAVIVVIADTIYRARKSYAGKVRLNR